MIELQGVDYHSQGYQITHSLSCSFPDGQTTIILGGSGSGKSSLAKLAAGLLIPDQGKVFWNGRDLAHLNRRDTQAFFFHYGFGFQDSALWSNQSVRDNLILPLQVMGRRIDKAQGDALAKEFSARLGFTDSLSVRPAELSLGEQKLISLARAMIIEPQLLILDEPMAFLDESSRERVMDAIIQRKNSGQSQIIVSHSSELCSLVADRLVVLRQGRLVAEGPYSDLIASDEPTVSSLLRKRRRQAEHGGSER